MCQCRLCLAVKHTMVLNVQQKCTWTILHGVQWHNVGTESSYSSYLIVWRVINFLSFDANIHTLTKQSSVNSCKQEKTIYVDNFFWLLCVFFFVPLHHTLVSCIFHLMWQNFIENSRIINKNLIQFLGNGYNCNQCCSQPATISNYTQVKIPFDLQHYSFHIHENKTIHTWVKKKHTCVPHILSIVQCSPCTIIIIRCDVNWVVCSFHIELFAQYSIMEKIVT